MLRIAEREPTLPLQGRVSEAAAASY